MELRTLTLLALFVIMLGAVALSGAGSAGLALATTGGSRRRIGGSLLLREGHLTAISAKLAITFQGKTRAP